MIALFLADFASKIGGSDQRLWVIVGDLPSAYLVVNDGDTPAAAFNTYCDLMDDWADAVSTGSSLRDAFPVAAEPTLENVSLLRKRTAFIRSEIIRKRIAKLGPLNA